MRLLSVMDGLTAASRDLRGCSHTAIARLENEPVDCLPSKATRTNKSFIGVLWSAWSDGVVAHWVELIALEVEAAISSFTDLGPPQTRFTRSCVCPKLTVPARAGGAPGRLTRRRPSWLRAMRRVRR